MRDANDILRADGPDALRDAIENARPRPLDEVHKMFKHWLSTGYDTGTLDAALATVAAHKLGGDPLWLLIVSGPGNAKTETVSALTGAGAIITSTISSEGGLLSASPRKDHGKGSTGGLLRVIGEDGMLVIKDVTSILSMDRVTRGPVLAALREVYDGRWVRHVGVDGGRTLTWEGRITVIGAVTTAWDTHHAVVAAMGDRFCLVRADSTSHRHETGLQAIRNAGLEPAMRVTLAEAVRKLIDTVDVTKDTSLHNDEQTLLMSVADVVTYMRTSVEMDYRGEAMEAHAPEMPTRFGKQLSLLFRGGLLIGLPRDASMQLAIRCARDSMPPLRWALILDLVKHPGETVAKVRQRLNRPKTSVTRQLQALQLLGLTRSEKDSTSWTWHLGRSLNGEGLSQLTKFEVQESK